MFDGVVTAKPLEWASKKITNIKFLAKLGQVQQTLNLFKAVYGEQIMPRTQVFEWHKRFSTGRDDVGDDPKTGSPLTSVTEANIKNVRGLIRCDRRQDDG